jgi:transposase
MEATRHSRWFERLLAELGSELWIGDPAEIKAKRVKKQEFDRDDARLLLRLLRENNFPQIWVPGPENRDLRQLLWHPRLVQMRTRIKNQLQALAMNESYRWKKKVFSEQGRAQLESSCYLRGPVVAGKSYARKIGLDSGEVDEMMGWLLARKE